MDPNLIEARRAMAYTLVVRLVGAGVTEAVALNSVVAITNDAQYRPDDDTDVYISSECGIGAERLAALCATTLKDDAWCTQGINGAVIAFYRRPATAAHAPAEAPVTDFKAAVDEMKRRYAAGDTRWLLVSADIADHFLEAVPPIYIEGGFACSETYDFGVYFCFRQRSAGTALGRICSLAELRTACTAPASTRTA